MSRAPFGKLGGPLKESGRRVDFNPAEFEQAIEGHGYRLAWTRAAKCPCRPLNPQTDQSNYNCPRCHGAGYTYFGPAQPQDLRTVGVLSDVQRAVIEAQNAFVIRAIMTGLSSETQPWKNIGGWRSGNASLTVRCDNKLAYWDRLVAIDSTLVYYELLTADGGPTLATRYYVTGDVALVMDDNFRRYVQDEDFDVVRGRITWRSAPPPGGTPLSVHYQTYPTWIVLSHPHTVRNTYVNTRARTHQTPEGDLYDLPVQASARLEFLVHDDEEIS